MKISIDISNQYFHMTLYELLKSIDNKAIHNLEHGLRPPIGIFNISKTRFLDALNMFLDEYENESNSKKLYNLHLEIVESLNSYIDDTYHIIKCFYRKEEINNNRKFANEQLKAVIPDIINNYFSNICNFRELYSNISNSIKHNHARYNGIIIKSVYGTCKGFYISGIDSEGVLYPDKLIHEQYQGKHTGISYNYDIKKIIFTWLIICQYLESELRKIISVKNITLSSFQEDEKEMTQFRQLLDTVIRVKNIKEYYFINEYSKGVVRFAINSNTLELEYPAPKSYKNKLLIPNSFNVKMESYADGVTSTWALPYL